jgi:DNA-binding response OmpR family regulator
VLAVEDDADDFIRIERRLARFDNWNFEVDHARCLSAALTRLAKRRFDLVLVDLNLPDSSGVETCSQLHRAAPL